jgi:dTDP-4-dehydrorhamnose 3,5-epimerase
MSDIIEVMPTRLPDVKYLVRRSVDDHRGSFRRVFSQKEYAGIIDDVFVEDNISTSHRGVLRGLHYDYRMAKFVQALAGDVFDVVLDIRRSSPTFGQWQSFSLTGTGCEQLYVPHGFAHGFYVLSEIAVVSYKQTAAYDPSSEGKVLWNDPELAIPWPLLGEPSLSPKDKVAPPFSALP